MTNLMKPTLINASKIKEDMIVELKEEVLMLQQMYKRAPHLLILKATDDKACEAYIRNKVRIGAEIGINVEVMEFAETVTEEEIAEAIIKLFYHPYIGKWDGLIIQQPLYSHLNSERLNGYITYDKDADCFSSTHLGRLMQNKSIVTPCTPQGVIDILDSLDTTYEGKRVTVIGRSTHVGLSLSTMLTLRGAVVTTTHSKSPNLEEDVRNADIVISCVGKRNLIQPEWMKKDSILLGVGITYENGKQYTDYDIDDMLNNSQCLYVGDRVNTTGTMTVLNLMRNTVNLMKFNKGLGGK